MKLSKYERMLEIYIMLNDGKEVRKICLANQFDVDVRTIQRDLDDLRAFLQNQIVRGEGVKNIVYERSAKCYKLCKCSEL